jgi:hypothetical protein
VGSSETVSKRVFGGRGHQKPFTKRFLVRNRSQKGFWWEGSSETVSKTVFGGRGHQKPFPKGCLVGEVIRNRFQKGFLIRNRSQNGFWWELVGGAVSKAFFGWSVDQKPFPKGFFVGRVIRNRLLSCWERRPNQIELSVQASPLRVPSFNPLWKEVWRLGFYGYVGCNHFMFAWF